MIDHAAIRSSHHLHRRGQQARHPGLRLGVSLITAVLALYGLTAVASAATSSKPYSVTVNGSSTGVSVAAGSTTTFSFAIQDLAAQNIGSAEIVPPSGFTIDPNSITLSGGGSPTIAGGNNCPTDQVSPAPSPLTCLIVNNLTITPPSPTQETISFNATTTCATAGADSFGFQVQQANQFSGKPGNQSGPLSDPAAFNVTVSGSCTLEFVTQPADANPSAPISDQSYTAIPPANPIEVEALDGSGKPVSGAAVTLAIAASSPDPGKSALLAGAPVTPTDNTGMASFGGANIAQPGEYILQASSPGFPPVDSDASGFLIGNGTVCNSNTTCSANTSDPKNGQKDTLTATTSTTGTLTLILGLDSPFCSTSDGLLHAPDVTSTSTTNLTPPSGTFGKELSITFSSKLGPGHFEVCWSQNGGPAVVLGSCPKLTQPVTVACLLSPISKDNTTKLINEDILAPEGDGSRYW